MKKILLFVAFAFTLHADDWKASSPREEIRPAFAQKGNRLLIKADARPGLDGHWSKTFPVEGGQSYKFAVRRKINHLESPRRNTLVRILWRDENGKTVKHDEPGA